MSSGMMPIEQVMASYVALHGKVAVIAWDNRNNVTYCNKAFGDIIQTEIETIGKNICDYLRFTDFPECNFGTLTAPIESSAYLKTVQTEYRCDSTVFPLEKGYIAFCDRLVLLQSDIVDKMARMNLELSNLTWEGQKKTRTIEKINEQLRLEIHERKAIEAVLRKAEQQVQREIHFASRLQNAMLRLTSQSDCLEINTIYKPHSFVGGDLYFMDWRNDKTLLCGFLVDISGHGFATALHTSAFHVLLRELNEMDLSLSEQMSWLNQRAAAYFDDDSFACVLGFEIDLMAKKLRWTCAGISHVWLATKARQGVITRPGMFLGISENETFETHTEQIEVGACLYFMTDGFSDLMSNDSELPLNCFSAMKESLQRLTESEKCRDDMTAICVRVLSFPVLMQEEAGSSRTGKAII